MATIEIRLTSTQKVETTKPEIIESALRYEKGEETELDEERIADWLSVFQDELDLPEGWDEPDINIAEVKE